MTITCQKSWTIDLHHNKNEQNLIHLTLNIVLMYETHPYMHGFISNETPRHIYPRPADLWGQPPRISTPRHRAHVSIKRLWMACWS